MAKVKTQNRNPRLIKRGDVVRVELPQGGVQEEVIRDVSMVLHLANGSDVPVPLDADLTVVIDPDPVEELSQQVSELQSPE